LNKQEILLEELSSLGVEIKTLNDCNVTHLFLHRDRLLYTLQNCSSIASDTNYSVKDRIEAERLKVDVSLDLLKLASEGPMMAQIKHYKDGQSNVNRETAGSDEQQ
jgi:hypothetical protein